MFECIKRLIFQGFYNTKRVLNEDLLILILDYLPIVEIIELKKVSPQFSYCVKELANRKMLLVVAQNREAFQWIFYLYHTFSQIEENIEIIKNSIIRFKQLERKERNVYLKYLYKRFTHLNVLAINHRIDVKQIKALKKFSQSIDTLCLGELLLSSENSKSLETKIEKIGTIFGNTIRCLYIEFSNSDENTNHKIIVLLKKCPKLEEFKVFLGNSINDVIKYIPKTLRVLDSHRGYFENAVQYRQDFIDMIQRTENKFKIFRMCYPLDEELLQILSSKLDAKNLTINLCEIPIEYFFQLLLLQMNLKRLIICWSISKTLIVSQDLSRKYRFLKVYDLCLSRIKVSEQNFQTIVKCFPRLSKLTLAEIEFICDCNYWSTLCLDCSYQCFEVLSKCDSLRKLSFNSCNFRINCQSLQKFPKLCQIYTYSGDFESLVESVKQFCKKVTQRKFNIHLSISSEKITQLSQNIPKNLSIKRTF